MFVLWIIRSEEEVPVIRDIKVKAYKECIDLQIQTPYLHSRLDATYVLGINTKDKRRQEIKIPATDAITVSITDFFDKFAKLIFYFNARIASEYANAHIHR